MILREQVVPQVTVNLEIDEQRQIVFVVSLTKRLRTQALQEGDHVGFETVLDEVIGWEVTYFPQNNLAPL